MCGICGIFSKNEEPASADLVRKMAKILSHRGPDDGSITELGKACLGHRRLSIIDPARGRQPLQSEDKRFTLTYNGEIYNHEDIRQKLVSLGYEFKTRCDTEVVLKAFIEWQENCLQRFNGMFAFAIYDTEERKIFLARDRAGQKPLYYAECGTDFIFNSEIAGLKLHPKFNSGIDMTSLHLYINHLYVPGPDTIYACTKELSPGHYAILTESDFFIKKYWQPDYKTKTELSYDDAKIKLRELIMAATEKRLMSDVPLGAFLSGGIDSSIAVAAMSEARSSSLRTFTIGSHDNRYNEISYANMIASRFKTSHYTRIAAADSTANLKLLLEKCGQPFADSSILPTYQISAFAREHVAVVLSGDGADELFGGYERYTAMLLAGKIDLLPAGLKDLLTDAILKVIPEHMNERSFTARCRRFVKIIKHNGLARYTGIINRWHESELKRLYSPAMFEVAKENPFENPFKKFLKNATSEDDIEKFMELEFHSYLPGDVLTKVDRASMAASLEVRSPFLDHEVIEFAASLPLEWKIKGFDRKHILTEAFREMLPEEIIYRKKMGFGIPVGEWLREGLYEQAKEILFSDTAQAHGFFNTDNIKNILELHVNRKIDASYQLWALLCFEIWFREHA